MVSLHLALDHAPILSTALMILSTLTCSFPGHELVWLNTQGRAQRLEGRAAEGGADPNQAAALSAQALPWPEPCLCLRVTQKGEVQEGRYRVEPA